MSEEKNIIDELSEKGYSKRSIDKVLHHLMLEEIRCRRLYEKKSIMGNDMACETFF
jgi:hypothetical protein